MLIFLCFQCDDLSQFFQNFPVSKTFSISVQSKFSLFRSFMYSCSVVVSKQPKWFGIYKNLSIPSVVFLANTKCQNIRQGKAYQLKCTKAKLTTVNGHVFDHLCLVSILSHIHSKFDLMPTIFEIFEELTCFNTQENEFKKQPFY